MNLRLFVAALPLLTISGPVFADVPQRTTTATVFGNDPCPKPVGDEIVVCGRLPENERYRIPKRFRNQDRPESGPSKAWGAKVESLEAAQRFTMPGSCTAVGSWGQTGCTQAMLHQWYLERQQAKRDAARVP